MIPVLFTTYNRLEFTKRALVALVKSDCNPIIIYDNASTDETQDWIRGFIEHAKRTSDKEFISVFNDKNTGVAGAMNYFFSITKNFPWVAKVDNDTIVPESWAVKMAEICYLKGIDIMQARHPILKETYQFGFDNWVKTMKQDPHNRDIFYHPYVGGSGIIINRSRILEEIPYTNWILGGWNKFQIERTGLKKAFYTGVTIELLDMEADGKPIYKDIEYYKETKRL